MPAVSDPRRRRDPAPSRAAYRLYRLWLSPILRRFVRLGLPVFALVLAGGWVAADADRVAALRTSISDARDWIAARPAFRVDRMVVKGASPELAARIRARLAPDLPRSSFDIPVGAMRRRLEALDAVAEAGVQVRPEGVLAVDIEERVPAAIWRTRDGLELLDADGRRVASVADRGARPDLPLVAGAGADARIGQALALLSAAAPIDRRVRGLVRIGARRWDLVLDRGQRILLPETAPLAALERVVALDAERDLLARDLTTVDMRDRDRPTLRLAPAAARALRQRRSGKEANG